MSGGGRGRDGGGGGGGGGTAAAVGMAGIPATSRKVVQSLKEIVNCPESEIYAMLKECNMDPNDAVHRLLSQDPFHQVKSKREKKKEIKETVDSRPRAVSSGTSIRSVRGGNDRGGRSNFQFSSNESGVTRGKPTPKKENGPNTLPSSSSQWGIGEDVVSRRSTLPSEVPSGHDMTQRTGMADGISLPSQPPSGYHSTWLGVPGQMSMADIVKMGRPQSKATGTPASAIGISDAPHDVVVSDTSNSSLPSAPLPSELHQNLYSSQVPSSNFQDMIHEQGISVNQHVAHDDWSLVEQSSVGNVPSVMEPSGTSMTYDDSSSKSGMNVKEDNLHESSQLDDDQVTETNVDGEDLAEDPVESTPSLDEEVTEDVSRAETRFHDNSFPVSSYHGQGNEYEQHADDAVSSVAANLQQLNFHGKEPVAPPVDNNPAVILPDHLQISSADCSHLSFGSFGSVIGGAFSGSFASKAHYMPSCRNEEFYSHEPLRSDSNENVVSRSSATSGSYEAPPVSQTEVQGYTNSLPTNFLAPNVQPVKELEFSYAPFLATQSMPTKYSTTQSSISGPTMSMPETAKPGIFSTPQQANPQTMPNTGIPTTPSLAQHLAVHPYPQQSLPLGAAFPNLYGYPMLPQNYFLPHAFQQTYPSSNAYQQSPAAAHSAGIKYMLPQYKNSVSMSSLPQSAAVGSGYGSFGSSANIPGNFALNPSTAPAASTSYEELLNSHYSSLQQNENSGMWLQGSGSRTMAAALPSSTYYSYQGQNQQSGFRQNQQQPSQYGALLPLSNPTRSGSTVTDPSQSRTSRRENVVETHPPIFSDSKPMETLAMFMAAVVIGRLARLHQHFQISSVDPSSTITLERGTHIIVWGPNVWPHLAQSHRGMVSQSPPEIQIGDPVKKACLIDSRKNHSVLVTLSTVASSVAAGDPETSALSS
ncbi:hypothetical protein QJS04_geneDACA000776 [Acorus gramineus]|uniref:GBF-interacting protein 1 N-terminal domain-containing protein n=1 Tax=Acorus gramineus TaxID=55184 RepID=A0AAV9BDJ5_ACOGR|nr:hypothetical protein QJS04_geneDACA000776 [Acorus gramineus]